MMKPILLFLALFCSVNAFTIFPAYKTTTQLGYTVFGGIDEDETVEEDPHSVAYQRQAPQAMQNGAVADLSQYRDYDEVLEDEDSLNVDSFSHMSGQIMSGFHLTSMCGDD